MSSELVPAIEIRDLRFAYPDGRVALRGINLLVQPGERVAIVGPNGAGKSTLLLHINGILRGEGVVRIFGLEVGDGHLGNIRALVGLTFQDPDDQLFCPTVFEDVAFGPLHMELPEKEVVVRAEQALEQVGLVGFGQRVPHRLSLGERKRASLATVLSMDCRLLALDEPTSGLDPRGRRELISLLRIMPQTIVACTHDLALARELFSRVVLLHEGRIVADGTAEAILTDSSLLVRHGL